MTNSKKLIGVVTDTTFTLGQLAVLKSNLIDNQRFIQQNEELSDEQLKHIQDNYQFFGDALKKAMENCYGISNYIKKKAWQDEENPLRAELLEDAKETTE